MYVLDLSSVIEHSLRLKLIPCYIRIDIHIQFNFYYSKHGLCSRTGLQIDTSPYYGFGGWGGLDNFPSFIRLARTVLVCHFSITDRRTATERHYCYINMLLSSC